MKVFRENFHLIHLFKDIFAHIKATVCGGWSYGGVFNNTDGYEFNKLKTFLFKLCFTEQSQDRPSPLLATYIKLGLLVPNVALNRAHNIYLAMQFQNTITVLQQSKPFPQHVRNIGFYGALIFKPFFSCSKCRIFLQSTKSSSLHGIVKIL